MIRCIKVLLDTEVNESGFSAHELQTGYALLQTEDVTMAPFRVPRGTAETDLVTKLFNNFRQLYGILERCKRERLTKACAVVNNHRHIRVLQPGEMVFRKLPPKARPNKGTLVPATTGPYRVERQRTYNSVQLSDPATGKMIGGDLKPDDIPLEQILVGPHGIKEERKDPTLNMLCSPRTCRLQRKLT